MQRLIEAAKAYLTVSELRRVESQTLQASLSDSNKRERLEDAIAEAEQQAADDALPIDGEWLWHSFGASYSMSIMDDFGVCMSGNIWAIWQEVDGNDAFVLLPHIKTRGQLRSLIAALKGGE